MNDDEARPSDVMSESSAPRSLSETELAAICPFVRTLLVKHPDVYDEASRTMSRDVLLGFVRDQRPPGGRGDLEKVFDFFATANQTPFALWIRNVMGRSDLFSTDFPGSNGDHPGSTGIYSESDGAFDLGAFDRVIAHSSDGSTMTRKDVAAAIIEANGREENTGSALDLAKSAGEFALLFNLLGRDDGTMLISDMRTLFDQNEWPPGALHNLRTATRHQWNTITGEIMRGIIDLKFHDHDREREMERAMRDVQTVVGGPPWKP